MKNLKLTLFSFIFLGGLSTTVVNAQAQPDDGKAACTTMYTICNAANPDSHDGFITCMQRNGC